MWYPTMFVFLSDLVQCPQVHPTFFFFKMHPPLPAMQETQIQFRVRKISWRWKWQPTSVFLPGEFHGQRNLVDYSPWGCKELDMTEWLTHTHTHTEFLCFYLLCYLSLLAFLTWTTIKTSTLTSNVIATPCFTLCLPGWSFWGPHLIIDLLGLILTHSPSLSSE